MAFHNSGRIVTNGLVLSLDAADQNSYTSGSTTWFDLSGNGNNGTLTNSPTYTSTNQGSIVFDGVDDCVQVGSMSNIIATGQTEITVNSWIRTNVIGSYKKIFTNITAGSQTITGVYLSLGPAPYVVYFGVKTTVGTLSADYSANLSTSTYFNLCGTYNGALITLYLNGAAVSTIAHSGNFQASGITRISGYDNNAETWSGNIANISVYNRALSAQEILQNYNAVKSRFNLT